LIPENNWGELVAKEGISTLYLKKDPKLGGEVAITRTETIFNGDIKSIIALYNDE
jgi:hypothetical protein